MAEEALYAEAMEAGASEIAEEQEQEDDMDTEIPTSQEPQDDERQEEIIFGNQEDGTENESSSSSEAETEVVPEKLCQVIPTRTIPEQHDEIIRLHGENQSPHQISKAIGISVKAVGRVLESRGIAPQPSKRGRRAVLNAKEEEALLTFLLELDKVNLNWTWPLFHKLLEIIARKRDIIPNAKHPNAKLFSSKWLVGFTTRHKKQIALRVVDYGLSGPMQNRQKAHPGRMETFEQMVRNLYSAIGINPTPENVYEVQEMWSMHVESPKTRKVFAKKGRKNVRLTIGLPSLDNIGGQKKRVRVKRAPAPPGQQTVVILGPASGIPYQPPLHPPINDAALRLALNAFMIAGYSEEDGKKILRDLSVPVL